MVVHELHGCSDSVHVDIRELNREISDRFDRFITLLAKSYKD